MKTLFVILLLATAQAGNCQVILNAGDVLERKIYTRTNCRLQYGAQLLNLQSSSAVSKVYNVYAVNDDVYTIITTTTGIIDTLELPGQKAVYNTAHNTTGETSSIKQALNDAVDKPVAIYVSNKGMVLGVNDAALQFTNDTVLKLAGLQPEKYITGTMFNITAAFNRGFMQGYKWKDSTVTESYKAVTEYAVTAVADDITTVSLSGTVSEELANSNINGVLLVENASGLIVQKIIQCASSAYQTINDKVYTAIMRSAVTETCYKKK